MKQDSDDFVRWFCDELNDKLRQDILELIIDKGMQLPGFVLAFDIYYKTYPISFEFILNIREEYCARKLDNGLRKRTLNTKACLWNENFVMRRGVACFVDNEIVALMTAGEVVSIDIGSRHFDHIIEVP